MGADNAWPDGFDREPRIRRRIRRTAGPHGGHAHFWERAWSRRRFLQASGAAAAGAFILGSSAWTPALAKPHGAIPKPIPGGFPYPLRNGSTGFFHVNGPNVFSGPDTDPSTIFDFDGDIGFAIVDGTGAGRDTATHVETSLDYEVDLRFMQGKYIGEDGKQHHGTFALI